MKGDEGKASCHSDITDADEAVVRILRKADKPVVLAANKVDDARTEAEGARAAKDLRLRFAHGLTGELATRSRVPVTMVLAQRVRITPEVRAGGAEVVLSIKGLRFTPIEGAAEAAESLKPVWAAAGAASLADRMRVAWEWWSAHEKEYAHSKLWRVVKSMGQYT